MSTQLTTAGDPWWSYACDWAYALRLGAPPASVSVYGPILGDGETARLSTTAGFQRLLAGDGSYEHSSAMVLGSPAVMLGVLAAQGVVNHRRKNRARREATPTWTPPRSSSVVVTNERVMCTGPKGTYLDFWFGYVSEFYPDLSAGTVTFAFGDRCPPLRLAGPPAAAISLWSAHALYGPAWRDDVRLHPLRRSPQPTLPPQLALSMREATDYEWVTHQV